MKERNKRSRKKKAKVDRAREAADKILAAFEAGDVPEAIAHVVLDDCRSLANDDRPILRWSWNNRVTCLVAGHSDARTYKQWQRVGRTVRKGEKAGAYIQTPVRVPIDSDAAKRFRNFTPDPSTHQEDQEQESTEMICTGFKLLAVFGASQTVGDNIAEPAIKFVETLPLIEVARAWNIEVVPEGFTGKRGGCTDGSKYIKLAVKNLSTWGHELVHVADGRLQPEGLKGGQHVDQEVVAELGGAVLLQCLGLDEEADLGGCLAYVRAYAGGTRRSAIKACRQLIERTCNAVRLILKTADQLEAQEQEETPERAAA